MLGALDADGRSAFSCVAEHGPIRADAVAEALAWAESRARSTLELLAGLRLVRVRATPSARCSSRDSPPVRPRHHGHPRRAPPPRRLEPGGAGAPPEHHLRQSGRVEEEVLYTRYGNNPTQLEIARKYALPGAENAVFVASGMGATALAHLAVLRPGDHLVSSEWIYGGTQALFDQELGRFGITVTYVNPEEPRNWKRRCGRRPAPSSSRRPPIRSCGCSTWGPSRRIARQFGLALLVDGTFASPVNFRPLEHGADVVITSATKYLNGHSDVIAGAVAGSSSLVDEVIRLMQRVGPGHRPARRVADRPRHAHARSPDGAAQRQRDGGRHAGRRRTPPSRGCIIPDCQPSRPRTRQETLDGFGGMVGLELRGGVDGRGAPAHAAPLVAHAPSLGRGGEPCVRAAPHVAQGVGPAARAKIGIPDGFLRLSCGIEDADDIIADLAEGLG